MKIEVKELLKNLTKRIGNECELNTPQQVLNFIDKNYKPYENIEPYNLDLFVFCGEKSMYVFNHLFGKGVVLTNDEINKYNIVSDNTYIEYLYDGDIDLDWTEDIDFFKEENIPYIACIDKCYSDFKSFLNTLSIICKETNDTIKVECFTTTYICDYIKSGFEIDSTGNIKFYGLDFTINTSDNDRFIYDMWLFLKTFNCKSFDDVDSLNVPIELNVDLKESFQQFFEAAGFSE